VIAAEHVLPQAAEWVRTSHPHTRHLERALHWLDALAPDATPAMRLAALLHDIERASPDPDSPFDGARDWGREAYLDYHQGRCAAHLARWLAERDVEPGDITEAVGLVAVHERGGWPQADLVQAADSLSFIETLAPLLVDWVATGQSSRESALAKLDFMWERMRVPAARELGAGIYTAARHEVAG
jgi:hypothetical protein